MRILLDVDGVLADFEGSLRNHTRQFDVVFDQWDILKCLRGYEHYYGLRLEHDFWLTMEEYSDNISEAQRWMRNHEVVFVTSPWLWCDSWASARTHWLKARFGTEAKIIITEHKHMVRGDAFVDDKPENVIAWQKENPEGQAFLHLRDHNAGRRDLVTISSLNALVIA